MKQERQTKVGVNRSTDIFAKKPQKSNVDFYTIPIWNSTSLRWFKPKMKLITNATFLKVELNFKHQVINLRYIIRLIIYTNSGDFYKVLQLWKLLIIISSRCKDAIQVYVPHSSSEKISHFLYPFTPWQLFRLFS